MGFAALNSTSLLSLVVLPFLFCINALGKYLCFTFRRRLSTARFIFIIVFKFVCSLQFETHRRWVWEGSFAFRNKKQNAHIRTTFAGDGKETMLFLCVYFGNRKFWDTRRGMGGFPKRFHSSRAWDDYEVAFVFTTNVLFVYVWGGGRWSFEKENTPSVLDFRLFIRFPLYWFSFYRVIKALVSLIII